MPVRGDGLPFRSPRFEPAPDPSGLERLVDIGYRWRTPLGLVLAAVITGAVVLAAGGWIGPGGGDGVSVDAGPRIRSLTAETVDGADQPVGQQEVGTVVDGRITVESTTTVPPAGPTSTGAVVGGERSVTTTSVSPSSTTSTTPSTTASTTSSTTGATTSSTTSTSTSTTDATTPSTTATTTSSTASSVVGSSTTSVAPSTTSVEAETGRLLGSAAVATDHPGYTGQGYVGQVFAEGSGVALTVTGVPTGAVTIEIRYAAGPVVGFDQPARTLTMTVDGTSTQVAFPVTAQWSTWSTVSVPTVAAAQGTTIDLVWSAGDIGWVSIDAVRIVADVE